MREASDYLSPILVKELRQGLRAKVFTMAFLFLQGVMIIAISLGLTFAGGGDDEAMVFQAFFWSMVGLPIVVILPLSGLGGVRTERTANTLELMYLTRLSAFRILTGKWSALLAQALLLACAILPYVVLRYFLGGIELWQDLLALAVLLLGSAVFTAFTVGFSAFTSQFPRWILIVMGLILFQGIAGLPMMLAALTFSGVGSPFSMSAGVTVYLLGAAVLLVLLLLQIGSSRIAPPAENHSTRVRLIALATLALGAVTGRRNEIVAVLSFLIVLPICIYALCEPIRSVPSLYRPFTRRGAVGRLAGLVLYPGWPSGVVFSLLALVACGILFIPADALDEIAVPLTAFVGAIFVPMAVLRLWFRRVRKTFTGYFLIQMLGAFPGYIYGISRTAHLTEMSALVEGVVAVFPTSILMMSLFGNLDLTALKGFPEIVLSVVTFLGIVGLVSAAGREWATIRSMEEESIATTPPSAEKA